MNMGDHSDTDDNGDGEGVWSPDIEQCFREALLLFPPCGRRKHILQEEGGGKMYGRNELIARHIKMRTGKIRSRKQVSSHIQVLARRKAKAESGGSNGSSADLSAGSSSPAGLSQASLSLSDIRSQDRTPATNNYCDLWTDRPIVTTKIRLVEFSAFIEHRRLAQNLAPMVDPSKSSTFGPIHDLVRAANANHGQQATTCYNLMNQGTIQHGFLMPAYGLDQPRTPMTANNLSQQQLVSSPHHLNHHPSLQMTAPLIGGGSPYQNLQHGHSQLQQPFNNNQQHHQQMNQRNTEANNMMIPACASPVITSYQQQTAPTSSGFTRHSYVKIDYRAPIYRQPNKLERIDIDQIQDKFPEIGGPEGLFQRGPTDAFFLIKFWADINNDFEYNIEDQNSFFGFSCHFETIEPLKNITCSTKACSYGLQVVEKVEKIYGAFNSTNGRYSYDIDRSPMCEFMTRFIKKLRQLPELPLMNRILENFTVLQLVTSESSSEILLCIAYVFEIAPNIGLTQGLRQTNRGSHYHVYKLTKN